MFTLPSSVLSCLRGWLFALETSEILFYTLSVGKSCLASRPVSFTRGKEAVIGNKKKNVCRAYGTTVLY